MQPLYARYDQTTRYSPTLACNKKGGRRPYLDQVADCRSARSSAPRWHENRPAKYRAPRKNSFLLIKWCLRKRVARKLSAENPQMQLRPSENRRRSLSRTASNQRLPAARVQQAPRSIRASADCPPGNRYDARSNISSRSSVSRAANQTDSAYCAKSRPVVNNTECKFFASDSTIQISPTRIS
jgi:hypothetical protein